MKKRRTAQRLVLAKVIPALAKAEGNLSQVARMFGVTRQSVHEYVQRHPEALAAWKEAREKMKDVAESVLYKRIKAGQTPELIFYLKTQAKDRGYVERQEQTGADGAPLVPRTIHVEQHYDDSFIRAVCDILGEAGVTPALPADTNGHSAAME